MSAIDRAIEEAGGYTRLAKLCTVTYQAVQRWQRKQRIPAERVLDVERASGVSREQLRPDLYPRETVKQRKRAS